MTRNSGSWRYEKSTMATENEAPNHALTLHHLHLHYLDQLQATDPLLHYQLQAAVDLTTRAVEQACRLL